MYDIIIITTFVLVVCGNVLALLLHRKLDRKLSGELRNLAEQVSSSVEAGPKLNEVRDYYESANAEFQKLLNEARREGDRPKQERFRKLIERLNTLKSRTLDKSAKLLESNGGNSTRSKRRRRRRPRPPKGPNGAPPENQANSGPGSKA